MSPSEYLLIEKRQREIIASAENCIAEARKQANRCAPPVVRRLALASNIVKGAIIWQKRAAEHGGDYWNVVDIPLQDGDYIADDGCRYSLRDAYISIEECQP